MKSRTIRRFGAALLAVGLLVTVGCGDDDEPEATGDDASSTTAAEGETTTTAADAGTTSEAPTEGPVEVTAVDYAYEGLPDSVAAGTKLTLTNGSDKEVHELVAIALPPDEERSAAELVKLPEEEQASLASGPPAAVLVTPPGGAPVIEAVGDGTLTEPGRYLILCAIPTGADPDEYLKAAQESQGGPPDVPGGPPHFVEGMYGEVVVE